MEIQTLDPVARFHRALVEEILRSRPSYLSDPFTVAEIYQNLVPYRTHRDRIGVEMNGDYEDALLRLLAGEGDYLVLESEHAVREIREELASSNPNTGLYRAYAAADVRLNPLRMPRDLPDPVRGPVLGQSAPAPVVGHDALIPEMDPPAPPPAPSAPVVAEPVKAPAPAAKAPAPASPPPAAPPTPAMPAAAKAEAPKPSPRAPEAKAAPEPAPAKPAPTTNGHKAPSAHAPKAASRPTKPEPPADRAGPPSACHWCREPLPHRDVLNFCPFCGGNVHTAPCSNCGEELEVQWKFCVACGTAAGDRG